MSQRPMEHCSTPQGQELLLVGASVRSAAVSAVRAGMHVVTADLFGDRDIPPQCVVVRVDDYPQGLHEVASRWSPRYWMYTGGIENHSDLVEAISLRHALLGNRASTLARVRDPWLLRSVLKGQQIDYPEIRVERPEADGVGWLRKAHSSCGGLQISACPSLFVRPARDPGHEQKPPAATPTSWADSMLSGDERGGFYYQRYVRGVSCGAVFLACCGRARLWGVTRQLVGCRWAGSSGFRYVGSVGPVRLGTRLTAELQRVGQCLAEEFELRGLFGVDLIVAGSRLWVLEVNPRLTASVEIVEQASGLNAMALHWAACRGESLPDLTEASGPLLYGKAIVSASRDGNVNAQFYEDLAACKPEGNSAEYGDRLADLPQEGTRIGAGHPILTVFAQGHRLASVVRRLRCRAAEVRRLWGGKQTETAQGEPPDGKRVS